MINFALRAEFIQEATSKGHILRDKFRFEDIIINLMPFIIINKGH